MEDTNWSIVCTQYIPSLCPISKSIPRWHLKSSIKVVYFVTTKTLKYWIELQSLPVSLQVSMHSSLSPSAPEGVSAALACSVYTVQPLDRRHAHSLLRLCSKVVHVLLPFIPCTSMSRVTESYQSYPTNPPTTPDVYSAVPYSTTLTSPLLVSAAHSPSPEVELTETLWRSLEVIPIVPEAHSVSFGSASLIRYSYYIPHQY
jgi:hypothetical protein